MAFTATISSITPQQDNSGTNGAINISYLVAVNFADSASGFTSSKTYSFPVNTTQAAAVAQITADGTAMKSALATAGTLQSKVGSVITI